MGQRSRRTLCCLTVGSSLGAKIRSVAGPGPALRCLSLAALAALAALDGAAARAGDVLQPAPARPERLAREEAADSITGPDVNGTFTLKGETRLLRGDDDDSDHDLFAILDLRVGDQESGTWSAAMFARADWDFDSRERGDDGSAFLSLADTEHEEWSTLFHTGYLTWRPESALVESARFGRQYVDVAETFHIDGVSVATDPVWDAAKLRLRGWAGVPVHYYEEDGNRDRAGGVQATFVPWRKGRAAVDAAYVRDEIAGYGAERNEFAAAQVWHAFSENLDAHGRFTWLESPRDAKVRLGYRVPDQDLVLQSSYFRLLHDQDMLATEFDPYYSALRTLRPYHTADLRAVKGFGERVSVEVGAAARRLLHDADEGEYNRETTRVWVTPTVEDVIWDGLSVSVGGEIWEGDDERVRTWTADVTRRFSKDLRVSVGSDFTLWDQDRLLLGERERVRSEYGRLRAKLADDVNLDFRYSWERDEEGTFHVVTLALAFDF